MAINRELSQFASFVSVNDSNKKIGIGTLNSTLVGIGTTDPQKSLHIYSADCDIKIGNITEGTSSTDGGVIFTGLSTFTSALFTEVNGSLLSLGVNCAQITGINTSRIGGIIRLDTRTSGAYGSSNCFAVRGRQIGMTTEYNAIVVGLNDGNTYLSPVLGNVGIGTTNPQVKLDVAGGNRFGGVFESVSIASTYLSGSTLVLELDCQKSTTYTYSLPSSTNVGIVSFKNMLTQTGVANATTVTVLFTQNATGSGNTTASTGIGTNITVVGYENGATVTGISTRAFVGTGTTITLSTTANDTDFVSFYIYYNGQNNTSQSSYKVYATKNGGFR